MKAQTIRAAALCVAVLLISTQTRSAELALPRDGWASWQVEAVEEAPAMCCWSSWKSGDSSQQACKLDEERGNFGTRDHARTDAVRMYARVTGGKVERLRVLAANCPVEARSEIRDLGKVAVDDSTRWLSALARQGTSEARRDDFRENLLAALALHRGDLARDELAGIARKDPSVETRKHAVFWLAHLRGVEGAEITSSLMFGDPEPEVRKHAAFAITQSQSPRIAAELVRLANTDKHGDVRAQAWFWLAHTGAEGTEAAIGAALRKDTDDHVREHAIFALSQLPAERATKALIKVVEDASLTPEQRKRALFWLGQSESPAAADYLQKVLVGQAAR